VKKGFEVQENKPVEVGFLKAGQIMKTDALVKVSRQLSCKELA
jgi:hypothetical protein